MSTNDVPGANPANRDELKMGCWSEHADGTLIFVESTEGGICVYSIFELARRPVVEYRDAMAVGAFKEQYSFNGKNDRWIWHDKTPFPWDRVMSRARDGVRYADSEDFITAAERIRRSRELHNRREVRPEDIEHRVDRVMDRVEDTIIDRLQRALSKLPVGKGSRKAKRPSR